MTNIKQCDQKQCCFKQQGFEHLCPRCSQCGANPHEIDEDCDECWNCYKDIDKIRNGLPDGMIVRQPEMECERDGN